MLMVLEQIESGNLRLGEICDREDLQRNLAENAIPELIFNTTAENYKEFLAGRRFLMATMIKEYYDSL
ncbi:hypothetical protein ACQ661_10555 [Pseudidiomarina sp. WS423]